MGSQGAVELIAGVAKVRRLDRAHAGKSRRQNQANAGILYGLEHLPKELQDNPYLLTGYRGLHLTHCECLSSAFRPNNQTWNVWTSVFGVFLFVAIYVHVFAQTGFQDEVDWWVFTLFLAASVAMNVISASAHLLSVTSVWAYQLYFSLDWAWIAVLWITRAMGLALYNFPFGTNTDVGSATGTGTVIGTGTGVDIDSQHQFTSLSLSLSLSVAYGVTSTLLTLGCFLSSIYLAKYRLDTPKSLRVLVIIPAVVFMEAPVLFRIVTGTASHESIMTLAMMGFGILLYAKHFPEKIVPRHFDSGLYSHPIWHTCYISANYYDVLALLHDYCVEKYSPPKDFAHSGTSPGTSPPKMCGLHSQLALSFWAPVIVVGSLLAYTVIKVVLHKYKQIGRQKKE